MSCLYSLEPCGKELAYLFLGRENRSYPEATGPRVIVTVAGWARIKLVDSSAYQRESLELMADAEIAERGTAGCGCSTLWVETTPCDDDQAKGRSGRMRGSSITGLIGCQDLVKKGPRNAPLCS